MEIIEVKAPAKTNIGLNIVSKREDGFHNLETVFYQIHDLYDVIVFEKSDKLELILLDDIQELGKNNIIINAVKLLEKKVKKDLFCKITLKKNIPIGAGLGGGSSDGASTLKAVNKLFELGLRDEELKTLALKLGSDVPLFLYDYPTIGKSRGEDLAKLDLKIRYPILLVNPGIHISTKDAFSNITPRANIINYSDIQKYEIDKWNGKVINDFENNVFELYPEIAEIKNTLVKNGALFSLMSGTGSTVYGIFESLQKAEFVAELFPKTYFTFVGNL
ncbi:MAG: 4-(cytidine 5'-diphospho)-2-C-methyl-D-erythritol kinase [Melioribacteraceae bacterium]|nr:4-(cytidine 5'-diphospho)-2-C-methyl-D-erythritol kinase [Melioribacteraceae bacterium]